MFRTIVRPPLLPAVCVYQEPFPLNRKQKPVTSKTFHNMRLVINRFNKSSCNGCLYIFHQHKNVKYVTNIKQTGIHKKKQLSSKKNVLDDEAC